MRYSDSENVFESENGYESISLSRKNEITNKNGKYWVAIFIVVISFTRIGNGIFFSLSGPTLLYLADNVDASVGQVSSMFTGRSAGFFVGAIAYGIVKNRFKTHKPLTIISIGIIIGGFFMLITPWVTNLGSLITITTISGLMFGYFDVGFQSLYLELWGEKRSRPYIQSFHFMYGVGAFLAPIIASPFLQMADQGSSDDDTCPNKDIEITTTVPYNFTESTSVSTSTDGLNPVAWTYIMSGAFTMVIGGVMLICAFLRIEDKIRADHTETAEQREEEPLSDVWILLVTVAVYYFMCGNSEALFQTYIYSVALCSDLQFSIAEASFLNTLFWIGFMIGRGSGMFYAKYFTPKTIIIYDLIGTTTGMVILSIFGRYIPLVVWIISFFHGLTVATLYPSGISWTSSVTNVSGTYIFVFGVGETIGTMSMIPLGGVIFDLESFNVIYLICAICVCNDLAFLAMIILAKIHMKKQNAEKAINKEVKTVEGSSSFQKEKFDSKKSRL